MQTWLYNTVTVDALWQLVVFYISGENLVGIEVQILVNLRLKLGVSIVR